MLCERCKERPATFFLTRIVNGEKSELHLCQQCAAETGQLGVVMEPQFSFANFLAGLLNNELGFTPVQQSPSTPQCKRCGLTYDDFRQVGQFACSHCYEEFEPYLEGVFRRVQGGTEHAGKRPAGAKTKPTPATPRPATAGESLPKPAKAPSPQERLEQLRRDLSEAVAREEYERAAELRDEIRRMEKALVRGRKETGGPRPASGEGGDSDGR